MADLVLGSNLVATTFILLVRGSGVLAWFFEAIVVFLINAVLLAIPLARLSGALLRLFNPAYNDFKRERIELFVRFIAQRDADVSDSIVKAWRPMPPT